jgi:uncharacterized protein (UPF0254 family)
MNALAVLARRAAAAIALATLIGIRRGAIASFTLNFHLLFASVIFAGTVASFQKELQFPVLRLPAGVLLCLRSFAFWRLDTRNRRLINAAESTRRVRALGPYPAV